MRSVLKQIVHTKRQPSECMFSVMVTAGGPINNSLFSNVFRYAAPHSAGGRDQPFCLVLAAAVTQNALQRLPRLLVDSMMMGLFIERTNPRFQELRGGAWSALPRSRRCAAADCGAGQRRRAPSTIVGTGHRLGVVELLLQALSLSLSLSLSHVTRAPTPSPFMAAAVRDQSLFFFLLRNSPEISRLVEKTPIPDSCSKSTMENITHHSSATHPRFSSV